MIIALRRLASLYTSVQFARFLVVGGIALALQWLTRFAFNPSMDYRWAIVAAYGVGMLVAFILNKISLSSVSRHSRWCGP
jgi:putative flippase GtrA